MPKNLSACRMLELPKVSDRRGNLTFVEAAKHVPFPIERVFYVYDAPTAERRGAHAHHSLHQAVICLAGSVDVEVFDGFDEKTFHLNRPWQALYLPPMIWAAEANFAPGTVYLVLCSTLYNEADYIRDFEEFKRLAADAPKTTE
jgi:hypothetical protein